MAKLYFYYSAMNAGKSTMLLQSNYNYQERGMNTLLFTPDFDDRFAVGKIHSRIGLSADATPFNADFDLFACAQEKFKQVDNLRCVLVDEAHFLTKAHVLQLSELIDSLNIPVLCYGIRTDFRGELFPGSQALLAYAEELIEIKTICFCGRKATMNMRLDEQGNPVTEGAQIEIGGNDRYIATCHKHFKKGLANATARTNHP